MKTITGNQYKYVRDKNRESYKVKYSLTRDERVKLIEEVGVNGLVLFEYYLRMASIEDVEITDEGAAHYFGWNIHTAGRWRRALIKKGWFYSVSGRLSHGKRIHVYYLGKKHVSEAKESSTHLNRE